MQLRRQQSKPASRSVAEFVAAASALAAAAAAVVHGRVLQGHPCPAVARHALGFQSHVCSALPVRIACPFSAAAVGPTGRQMLCSFSTASCCSSCCCRQQGRCPGCIAT